MIRQWVHMVKQRKGGRGDGSLTCAQRQGLGLPGGTCGVGVEARGPGLALVLVGLALVLMLALVLGVEARGGGGCY